MASIVATSATWRPVLDGGRPTKEAAGQLPAARPWLFGLARVLAEGAGGRLYHQDLHRILTPRGNRGRKGRDDDVWKYLDRDYPNLV